MPGAFSYLAEDRISLATAVHAVGVIGGCGRRMSWFSGEKTAFSFALQGIYGRKVSTRHAWNVSLM
jgi:hypothetical protein